MSAAGGGARPPDEPGPDRPDDSTSAIRRAAESCRRALRSWAAAIGPAGRIAAGFLLLGGIAGAVILVTRASQQDPPRAAGPGAVRAVPNEYVVIFGGGIPGEPGGDANPAEAQRIRQAVAESEAVEAAAIAEGGKIRFRYRSALIGFSAVLPPAALKAVIRASRGRARIEPNWEARKAAASVPAPSQGLDRIGQRLLPLDNLYDPPTAGSRKVHVYILDGALVSAHRQFRVAGTTVSRIGNGQNFAGTAPWLRCFKHGTHVAGIIGGSTFGVAPTVELHSVRVMDCDESVQSAWVIAGVDWIAKQYRLNGNHRPAVANMSLQFNTSGIPASKFTLMEQAIRNTIALGIPFVVSAGNDDIDACFVSPARISSAITVGSTDPESDERANSSNFGQCVDLFAPGVAITSAAAHVDDLNASDTEFGTSSAAPHVTGVAALFLSRPGANPGAVWAAIFAAANRDSGQPGGTQHWCGVRPDLGPPDRLLHWGAGSTDGKEDSLDSPQTPRPCQ